jgi:prepilin-type processing-associated H-X9-DG protein
MRTDRSPPGSVRVEAAALLAVAALAAGLAAPGVARLRQASHRAGCADNLRVMAHACLQFEGSYGFFPSSIQRTGPQRSWAVQVLPWLGEEGLARRYDYARHWCDPANAAAAAAQLPRFYCPASPTGPRTMTGRVKLKFGERHEYYEVAGAAGTDYAAVDEVKEEAVLHGFAAARGPGVLKEDQFPRRADITDGLANTVLITECAGRPDEWVLGRPGRADGLASSAPWASRSNDFGLDGFDPANPDADAGPCAVNCTNANEVYAFHPGGANAALADGGVRFVADRVGTRLFARLVTRAGGEPVDWADY